ncbi:hypothetical protein AFCDBAGC_1313 [Methylobacterium cerastii]|uniref:XRE family transcriptional regulator n=1 Tax=Methylobacterium cerastii TaxID=932741 RepID=A0ABQ4QFB5_9HYPH|nr:MULTISPECIES: hypothetical protein [Methylobacterium]TXM95838.1 hypothetical protein FV219_17515 [Methylobacterium sp. WL122]TXM55479.1 hypothetical protein FV229_26545 [Methylobacterium sp. WL120]TXM71894.1 hypothetical protein FV226_13975 [Methylobacterium sp. WL12]TXN81977.1 hypothetical protein FV234_11565 [Methylobacterium sp. WL8]GJD43461.1 hypothetical protein AFCDBAGC_1313 [Methylobacterium cerastii]
MEDGRNDGSDRSERAQILLGKIAELLRVDTAFFLGPRTGVQASDPDPAELLRLFQSIGDAELRRSVIAMLKDLEAKDDTRRDS